MTRTQIYRCLKRCVDGACVGCQLENVDDCVKILMQKSLAVIRFDNGLIQDLQKKLIASIKTDIGGSEDDLV